MINCGCQWIKLEMYSNVQNFMVWKRENVSFNTQGKQMCHNYLSIPELQLFVSFQESVLTHCGVIVVITVFQLNKSDA